MWVELSVRAHVVQAALRILLQRRELVFHELLRAPGRRFCGSTVQIGCHLFAAHGRLFEVQLAAKALEYFARALVIIILLSARDTPANENSEEQAPGKNAEHGSCRVVPHVTLAGVQSLAGPFFCCLLGLRCTLRGSLRCRRGRRIHWIVVVHKLVSWFWKLARAELRFADASLFLVTLIALRFRTALTKSRERAFFVS